MSKEEHSVQSKKIYISSNDSLNKKDEGPIRTSQSMNTESYEYFSQRITTKNNITESSYQGSNQKIKNQELKCTCNQNSDIQKNLQELKCTCGEGQNQNCTCGKSSAITGSNQIKIKTTTTSTTKYNNSVNINNQNIINEKKEISMSTEGKVCNCAQRLKVSSQTTNINIEKSKILKEKWNQRCVGQNNENLQILAAPQPELLIQCVQDINVIQEPRPVQIILPVVPNEIDYPLGLEIYGKEKKVLICPENVENLDVSKAYSTIKPQFENLNIGQNENVFCERVQKKQEELNIDSNELALKKIKKSKYDIPLTLESGEMFVKGQKDFNKENAVELTTKMNVRGKQKLSWNETNEAIKTTKMNIDKNERNKFDNLYVENNTYKYQGKLKNKYGPTEVDLEQNEEMVYPAEYVSKNWNDLVHPMTGKPFTLDRQIKKFDLSKSKPEKITIKKAYDTVDWNKKNNKRKEVQITMKQQAKKKETENKWNNLIKKENDSNINIERTKKTQDFVLSHGDEVTISNEAEEILVNDDYNIVEENYTRPIRANIRKIQDVSEESVSSEYDVLKGIKKYMGQYQYKDVVDESIKIQGQKIIINDISGKYPRRIESFKGPDENFEKFMNDKSYHRNFNVQINTVNVQKKVMVNNEEQYQYEHEYRHEEKYDNENEIGRKHSKPEDAREPQHEQEHEPEPEHEHEQENVEIPEDKDHMEEEVEEQPQQQSQEAEGEREEENVEQNVEENVEQNVEEHYQEGENREQEHEEENAEVKEQSDNLQQNEEKNDSEPRDEIEKEQEEINQNEEGEVKDVQQKEEPKIYIKEITYTKSEENPEGQVTNLKFITLKKKEEEDDTNIQQQNAENENLEGIKPQIEKVEKEENVEEKAKEQEEKDEREEENDQYQYVKMLSQKVEEQHISKSENDIKSDLEEPKEEVKEEAKEEQHISQDEENRENELNEEINNREEDIELENKELENQGEEHLEEHIEQNAEQKEEQPEEEQRPDEEHLEEHVEEHLEEHVEEHVEENVEENNEQQVEQPREENLEEHVEYQVDVNNEEHNEINEDENHLEEQVEEKREEELEQIENNIQGNEEGRFEEQENDLEVHNEEQNIEQENEHEIHEVNIVDLPNEQIKENVINKDTRIEGKKISEIVAEAIKESFEQEEERMQQKEIEQKGKEDKYNLMVNAYSQHIKANPLDNYNQTETININNINNIPTGAVVQTGPNQSITQAIQTKIQTISQQKVETGTNTNPMVYSFGAGSVESSHLSSSNKNTNNINLNVKGSGLTFGLGNSLTQTQYVADSNVNLDNKDLYNKTQTQSSGLGMSGKYYFTKTYTTHSTHSTHSNVSKSNKEPKDTDKRKKMEREIKAKNEIDDLVLGPRDSKRK